MFESFYGLNANPFRLSPDERFLYVHTSYVKARSYLKYALERAEGFVMVTGPPGSGKTLLVQDILSELDPAKILVAHLVSNQLHAEDLLRMVALVFGFHAETYDKATLLNLIQRYVTEQHEAGRRAILIIDDAQNLPAKSLEELRLLSNLQTSDRSLIQIFLIGQDELRGAILAPGMEQFSQRLIATCRIEAMNSYQTQEYIEHRLDIAGWRHDPLLDPAIFPLIHKFTRGIPRQINHLAGRTLLFGALEGKHTLHEEDIWTVLEELHEEQLLPLLDNETLESVKAAYKAAPMNTPPASARPSAKDRAKSTQTTLASSAETITKVREKSNRLAEPEQESICPPELLNEPLPEAADNPPEALTIRQTHIQHVQDSSSTLSLMPPEASISDSVSAAAIPQPYPPGGDGQTASATPPDAALFLHKKTSQSPKSGRFFHRMAYFLSAAVILLALVVPKPSDLPLVWQEIKHQGKLLLWGHSPGQEEAETIPGDLVGAYPPAQAPGSDVGPIIPPQADMPEAEIAEAGLIDTSSLPLLKPGPQAIESTLTQDPDTGKADNLSVPQQKDVQDLTGLDKTHQVLFRFDSSRIEPEHIPVLEGIISSLRRHTQTSIQITGFTDSIGDPVYNKLLSSRRADAIANHLLTHGIAQERIYTLGEGPLLKEPGMEIESLKDRLSKRRVELQILLPDSP